MIKLPQTLLTTARALSPKAAFPLELRVIQMTAKKLPSFVCTKCRLQFNGETAMNATCPECGGIYGHFFTPLIRCGTSAIAYWLRDNPGEIQKHEGGVVMPRKSTAGEVTQFKYFTYEGIPGVVDEYGYVNWRGIGFHKENANGALRSQIDKANALHIVRQYIEEL